MIPNRQPNSMEDIIFQKFESDFIEFITDDKIHCKTKRLSWETTLNTWPQIFTEQLLRNVLTNADLSSKARVMALKFIINEKFNQFNFYFPLYIKSYERKILEILYEKCPKLEYLNLGSFFIRSSNRVLFENLLMKCDELKVIRVKCRMNDCAIRDILLGEYLHDLDYQKSVQTRRNHNIIRRTLTNLYRDFKLKFSPATIPRHELPLDKIVILDMCPMFPERSCTQILRLLPNLQGLVYYGKVGKAISYLNHLECRNLKLKYIRDERTSLHTLEKICYHCPDLKKIRLTMPESGTLRQLSILKKIHHIDILWFSGEELNKYLQDYGNQIYSIQLCRSSEVIDLNLILSSCPNLIYLVLTDLEIKYQITHMPKYPNIRHFFCGRVSTIQDIGMIPLLYHFTKLETLELNDRSLTHQDIEELVVKLKLWRKLKTLYLCGRTQVNKKLTIKSLRLILNNCKYIKEIRNIHHFAISASELSQLNKEYENCANKCKLIKQSTRRYFC